MAMELPFHQSEDMVESSGNSQNKAHPSSTTSVDPPTQILFASVDRPSLSNPFGRPLPPSSIPPDVLESRRKRINSEIRDCFLIPRDPNDHRPPSLQGMGTYTHIQSNTPSELEFLSLGGPQRDSRPANKLATPNLPEAVKAAYETLKEVLEEEEKLDWTVFSPRIRFDALPPQLGTRTALVPRGIEVDTEMGGLWEDDNDKAEESGKAQAQHITASSNQPSWGGPRRTSLPSGGTATRKASAGGTLYDPSRDPRMRGR